MAMAWRRTFADSLLAWHGRMAPWWAIAKSQGAESGDRVPRDPRGRDAGSARKRQYWSGVAARGSKARSRASSSLVVSRERVCRTQLFMRFRVDFDGGHRSGSVVTGERAPQRSGKHERRFAFASCGVPRYRRVTERPRRGPRRQTPGPTPQPLN